MEAVAVSVSLVVALGAVYVALRAHQRSTGVPPAPAPSDELDELRSQLRVLTAHTEALRAQYADIDEWRDDLTIAVSEGVKNVQRAENRIRATVRRAREELGALGVESPGLEAEASELRLIDGGGGEAGGVPPVRAELGDSVTPPPGFPGSWSSEHLRYLRGA